MSTKTVEKGHFSNPFLASFSITPRYISRKVTVEGRGTSFMEEQVDFNKFTAYDNFPFEHIPDMSRGALVLLMYALSHLKWKQDYLEIRYYEQFDPEHPYRLVMSKSLFYKSINDLVRLGIIAKRQTRDKTYWINPSMFFQGSRLAAFPDNIGEGVHLKRPTSSSANR
jgi:hypothetical protein